MSLTVSHRWTSDEFCHALSNLPYLLQILDAEMWRTTSWNSTHPEKGAFEVLAAMENNMTANMTGVGRHILWHRMQNNTAQYNTILYALLYYAGTILVQYNTIQYNTIQYNTIQYNTIQYVQYNTNTIQIQYKTLNTQCNARQCNTGQHDHNHIVIHQGPGLKGAVPVQRLRKDGFVSNEAWIRTLSWAGAVGYRPKIYLGDEIYQDCLNYKFVAWWYEQS